MRRILLTMVVGPALFGATTFNSPAAGANRALSGHVPAAVAKLPALDALQDTNNLDLAISLPLRNREELTNLLHDIYNPASPNYHHYLTPEEFTAQFGPTEQDYQAVINFAKANGLKVKGTHPNRVVLDVSAKAGVVGKAFHVNFHNYRHPKEARTFFAPDTEPTVDASLPILDVGGMNNYSLPHPKFKMQPLDLAPGATPAAGTGPGGSYAGKDFRTAYAPGVTLTGAGQNVGLLQFDGFYANDIAAYASLIGLTSNVPQLVVVPVDGGVSVPTPFGNPEVSLDIEMILAMSPGVTTIYVYEAPNPSPWVDILSKMANDNLAKQLSCSWGGGGPNAAAEQIFQQMALQGQSFFNASGDSDAFDPVFNPIQYSFPSESPHITEVGGTFLTTGSGAAYGSETVWNRGVQIGSSWDGVGSSGGISTTYSIPSWQTNINFAACQGSSTMRNVPDVALTAENCYVIYGSGRTGAFGGTSCAAPLWAGFTALVNQQAAGNSMPPVGFLNPALYAIAKGANYTTCFHDTTTGNNEWSGSPTLFSAVANYDLCTGLGTPNGAGMINALAGSGGSTVTHISAPLPPYGTTLGAVNGGNPNGNWELFVQDDLPLNSGVISNGWFLTLTTANPVGTAADLMLAMTVSTNSTLVGGTLTYVITVTNFGPSISSNAVVTDFLPAAGEITLVSEVPTLGSVLRNPTSLVWTIGTNLNVNAGARLTVTLKPAVEGTLLNQAIASSTSTPDLNPDDDYAYTTVAVGAITPPLFGNVRVASGKFILSITSPAYPTIVQTSTNLAATNWVNVFTSTPPFWYTNNATNPALFYRALLLLP